MNLLNLEVRFIVIVYTFQKRITKSILDKNYDNVNKAKELQRWLQSNDYNENNVFSPMFVSMHPAGGNTIIDPSGQKQWVPNTDLWSSSDSDQKERENNAFKTSLLSTTSPSQFQIDMVNKIMTHQCSLYCLRRKTIKTNEKDNHGNFKMKVLRYCRHHFGNYNEQTKTSEGKEINPFTPRIVKGKIERFEGRNDHPRMVQHMALRPLTWLAQCDTQPIISQDMLALIRYITGYCCKGATTTQDLLNMYSDILQRSEENVTVKSVAQKLILKTVGAVDTPASAADFINIKGKLYHCSRKFRKIGLSGFRVFNSKGDKEGNVTNKSAIDGFLALERRKKFPDITLYEWAKICNCPSKNKCGKDHVPVITSCVTNWVWPVTEDLSKSLLMMFSPGTWVKVDDLKSNFATFTESFSVFLDSDICPESVKIMLQLSKQEFDKVTRKKNFDKTIFETSNINFSQSTEGSQESQDESDHLTFGNTLLQDIALQHKRNIIEAEVEEEVLFNGGEDYDWHHHALLSLQLSSLSEIDINESKEWLHKICVQTDRIFQEEINNCTLPDVNPRLVNHKQMIVVYHNIKQLLNLAMGNIEIEYENCKRLIIQGVAGTGKSQIIKILTRLVRRIFKSNQAVLNVAPTGAAAVLLPDGGTIHSTVHIPQKGRSSKTDTVYDHPMSAERMKAIKALVMNSDDKIKLFCINADERGMIGQKTLAWFHQRFCELSNLLLDKESDVPFGCIPTFNLFGDIFQLGAICDRNVYDIILKSTSSLDALGHTV